VRIGTWNLAGRWDDRHARLMLGEDCDVWMLTEVSEDLALVGYMKHETVERMAPVRSWAAIISRAPLSGLPDPHPASVLATVGDLTFCSSVLPWRSCPAAGPWVGNRHADKTKAAVEDLLRTLPKGGLVWGGDWNHAMTGREYVGSHQGRASLLEAVALLGLQVPTAGLPHRLPGLLSIDHIAVSSSFTVIGSRRVVANTDGARLSDHDAYVIEVPG
jgi:hypothetical protein